MPTSLKDFRIAYKEGDSMQSFMICLHHQKAWVSPTNNGGYKQELDRPAYTTKGLWYRLQ